MEPRRARDGWVLGLCLLGVLLRIVWVPAHLASEPHVGHAHGAAHAHSHAHLATHGSHHPHGVEHGGHGGHGGHGPEEAPAHPPHPASDHGAELLLVRDAGVLPLTGSLPHGLSEDAPSLEGVPRALCPAPELFDVPPAARPPGRRSARAPPAC